MQIFWDYKERSTIFSFGSIVTLYHLKYMYSPAISAYSAVRYVFWNIIYSLQELNCTTVWDSWCTSLSFGCFVLVFLSFLLLSARKTCALWRGGHGTDIGRPATGGLLESEASKQHRVKSFLLFLPDGPRKHIILIYCFLSCAILACKLGLHNHTLYSIDITILTSSRKIFLELLAFPQIRKMRILEGATPPCC